MTVVCLGLAFFLLQDTQFLMPGPLASAHGAIENCSACHTKSGSGKLSWIHGLVAGDPLADSKACLTCHKMPETAFDAHGASTEVLKQITKELTKVAAETPAPEWARTQSIAFPTHAGLSEANLRAANLRNARLDYADFAGADLSEANLRGANLQNAKNLTRSQLEQSLGDASTILPEHLQGSVAWSPARGETAPVAPVLAPSFVVRAPAKARSLKPLLWIAASVWITAFAAAAWWQYGESNRSPLSSTDRGPSELKIAQLPAFTALRTIDRPDVTLFARGDAPEAPAVVTYEPAAYTGLAALPATGLVGIAQPHPELADVRQVAAEQLSVHSDLGAADRKRPADDSLGPIAYAARLSNPEINLASAGTFETESLAPSALTSRQFTVVREAARSRLPLTFSVRPSAALPVLSALKTAAGLPLLESLPAQAIAAVPVAPLEGVELALMPPSTKVPLLAARVAARMPETKQQIAAGPAQNDPVLLSVSLNRQTIDVYRGTNLIVSSKVSSGMNGGTRFVGHRGGGGPNASGPSGGGRVSSHNGGNGNHSANAVVHHGEFKIVHNPNVDSRRLNGNHSDNGLVHELGSNGEEVLQGNVNP